MKICDTLKDMKKKAEDEMMRVWVYNSEFTVKCVVKTLILYYKRFVKALRDADPSYSNRYNNHIQY